MLQDSVNTTEVSACAYAIGVLDIANLCLCKMEDSDRGKQHKFIKDLMINKSKNGYN